LEQTALHIDRYSTPFFAFKPPLNAALTTDSVLPRRLWCKLSLMKIIGGKVYDPANGLDGKILDVDIPGGISINRRAGKGDALDAAGCVVMAGGIDVHSHPLGVSRLAALTRATELAAYTDLGSIVSEYLSIGHTFFLEAGLSPEEAEDAPKKCEKENIGCAVLLLEDSRVESGQKTPRKFIGEKGVEEFFRLPPSEPVSHVHLPRLAKPDSLKMLESFLTRLSGRTCHLSHVSHYGFEPQGGATSPAGAKAARILAKHPNVTFDCGPVVFGPALSFTADEELLGRISKSGGGNRISHPKSRFSATPYTFRKENGMDSLLWINAMELLLSVENLRTVSLSIDFPSGGRLSGIPHILACLMDREKRNGFLKTLDVDAVAASSLKSIGREFTLSDVATITRTSPSLVAGLKNAGHLGRGADSAVIYEESGDFERMFANPRDVIRKK
jgi:formylmethanofuran dehydrogenase subunit A